MIKVHEFNTQWSGQRVGIITDYGFFSLPFRERKELLKSFSWVECVGLSSQLPVRERLSHCGFYHADSQVQFRLGLRKVPQTCTGKQLRFLSFAERRFELSSSQMMTFRHERFYSIPGQDETLVAQRYAIWAHRLMNEYPETCIAGYLHDTLQGWFLSHPMNSVLDLTLAVLKCDAVISGLDFYSGATAYYCSQGYRIGRAGFSLRNTAVHNIFASIGARFTEPREVWFYHYSQDLELVR